MDRRKIRWLVNVFLVVAVFGSWLSIFFAGSGSLVQNGLGSLRYFTMLSNIFVGIVAAAWLVSVGKGGIGKSNTDSSDICNKDSEDASINTGKASPGVEQLKYIAASAVGLTFATVMFFLGPIYGYGEMFKGYNLPLHLIIPVAAILEIIFLSDVTYTRRDNLLAVIPPLLYGIGYLANILINGIGEWPATNDWYFFFYWGYPVGALIYVILLTAIWLIGFLMRKLQRTKSKEV